MARVTYLDLEGAAPTVTFRGQEFTADVPIEVEDPAVLDGVSGNRFFRVESEDADTGPLPEKQPLPAKRSSEELLKEARRKGRQAHASARDRAPPTRLSTAQRQAWLEGFDAARKRKR